MTYRTLITTDLLAKELENPDWVIFDCRFSLNDVEAGAKLYRQAHIRGARYAHLEQDLSSAITYDSGRHPLPDFSELAAKLGIWSVDNQIQIIVYDDVGGAFAGRMWWLLRIMGHDKVAVVDGGIKRWQLEGRELTNLIPAPKPVTFTPHVDNSMWLTTRQIQDQLTDPKITLIDARTAERFRGEQEPIDPVAGHIPGAVNRPFQSNLNSDGTFLTRDQLRQQFSQLIGSNNTKQVVHMCGSGVTACHNLLAMEVAGLTGSKLYAGSWSEWIRDNTRPVIVDY